MKLTKKLEKKKKVGTLKSFNMFPRIQNPCTCPGQQACSGEISEGSTFSPLAEFEALHKQEVKAQRTSEKHG